MSSIDVLDMSFTYEGSADEIFSHVSFRIDTDWKLGFIGRNGRGKTTFLRLLMGEHEYTGRIHANVIFEYFPYPVRDLSAMTCDIAAEICGNEDELWKIYRELSLLDLPEDILYRPFSTLSNGERTKVLLAAMFIRDDAFLLIDEPTNHLDMETRAMVSDYLNKKKGFILVSHDRAFLDGCIDHVLSLNRTNIEVQKGNFSSWQQNKDYQDSFSIAKDEKLRRDIARLEEAAKRSADWSDKLESTKYGTKNSGVRPDRGFIGANAARMMKRAKSQQQRSERAIEEKKGLLDNIETSDKLKIQPEKHFAKRLLSAERLSVRFGERDIFRDLSFELMAGERVALVGKNGSGKSCILKMAAGLMPVQEGSLKTASGLKISYVPQDTEGLQGNLREFAQDRGIDESLFLTILRKMDFERSQFDKNMRDYSAGQRKKVLLAASLSERANLYIWDEPLNYIDVLSRMQIEELLQDSEASMLFVEHDREFTEKIATKTIRL